MNPGLVVKLRPTGPWRCGSSSGAADRVDLIYHSDSLYSAVTWAMGQFGLLEEWIQATALDPGGAAATFSSCFPFQGDTSFVVPPKTVWPPGASSRVRWKGACFVPVSVVGVLLQGAQPLNEERWSVDGQSCCLLPVGARGPFRQGRHLRVAVDRMGTGVEPHATACLEFADDAGLWFAVSFAGEAAQQRWAEPIRASLRLLADSGFGGERALGWGRSEPPQFAEGTLPGMILAEDLFAPRPPTEGEESPAPAERAYWLLSLFSAGPQDVVDWRRGLYSLLRRSGRVDSPVRSGELKKSLELVEEGSVIFASQPPRGSASDVAPDGFPHPVFRAGFALGIPIPWRVTA